MLLIYRIIIEKQKKSNKLDSLKTMNYSLLVKYN